MVDSIPLKEVESVQEMSKSKSSVDKAKFSNAFMITTIPEGNNDGRTYYLQANDEDECTRLAMLVTRMAQRAYRKAHSRSQIKAVQFFTRTIWESQPFQLASAVLILAVGYPSVLSQKPS